MERNEVMVLDDIIYHLYDEEDFLALRRNLLKKLHMLLPFSYGSILLTEQNGDSPRFHDPVCDPDELLEIEEQYIQIAGKDHTSWSMDMDSSSVICESMMLSDEKRLSTPVYRQCYSRFNIYDSLQVNIASHGKFLGVLTLYRTTREGAFQEDDLFPMHILSRHLNRLFYQSLVLQNPEGRRYDLTEHLQQKFSLTDREAQILRHLFSGDSDITIAGKLSISPATLKKHLQHIYRKLQISSRWELMKFIL